MSRWRRGFQTLLACRGPFGAPEMTAATVRRIDWVGRFYLVAAVLLVPWVG